MPDEEQDKEHIYPLETEMPIGLGLSVKAFGQLSAMTSLMAPESEQLPVEVALVFENHGADSVVFEVDTNSAILVSSDGKDYRAEGFSVLLPDLTQHVQGGSGPVPFWLPAGKKAVVEMTFVPLRANAKLLLRSCVRGPVTGMRAVPPSATWRALPPIEVLIDHLPRYSTLFQRYTVGAALFDNP